MNLKINEEELCRLLKRFERPIDCWLPINDAIKDVVAKHPSNLYINDVATKLHMIGRLYSATVERRKNADDTPGDFVLEYAAPAIAADPMIDSEIKRLKKAIYLTDEVAADVLKLHGRITKALSDVCGINKRSLASKYLHFHLPWLTYIYDSRVISVIGDFIDKPEFTHVEGADKQYEEYYMRAWKLDKYIWIVENPKVLDNFLIRYCDAKRRGKL